MRLGDGSFQYEVVPNWEKLPEEYRWDEVGGVGVDSKDNVYVFNRGPHPMIVFDKDGNFLTSWGEDFFIRAHGLTVGPDDILYCTDDADHTVRKCTTEGEVLMTIGVPKTPSPYQSAKPFNRCTHVALDPETQDIYVSDGYGNSSIHKFTAKGEHLFSWGSAGTDPGQFNIPHNIITDKNGLVYVADRENMRVQIFDKNGNFLDQWNNMHRACALCIDKDQTIYLGEIGSSGAVNRELPNIGPRVSIYETNGDIITRLGTGYGLDNGQFIAPHGICVDSKGNIYVGEVTKTEMSHQFRRDSWEGPPPIKARSFQKLARI